MKRLLLVLAFLLWPLTANAAIRWVGNQVAGASDAHNCTNNTTDICLTIPRGIATMGSGDTLNVKTGTYSALINGYNVPTGLDEAHRTQLIAVDGAGTVLYQNSCPDFGNMLRFTTDLSGVPIHHVTIDGWIFDGSTCIAPPYPAGSYYMINVTTPAHDIRFTHVTIRNGGISNTAPSNNNTTVGAQVSGANNTEFLHSTFYRNGWGRFDGTNGTSLTAGYAIYQTAGTMLIDDCDFIENGAYGLHMNSEGIVTEPHGTVVKNSRWTGNGIANYFTGYPSAAIRMSGGQGDLNQAFNNVVYNNYSEGIECNGNNVCYNNTVYSNGSWGLAFRTDAGPVIVRNNIVFNNGAASGHMQPNQGGGTTDIYDSQGTNLFTFDHNLCGTTTPLAGQPAITCTIVTDPTPTFVDVNPTDLPNHHNFNLKTSPPSPAIDAGIANIAPGITIVNFAGSAPDLGAFESSSVVVGPLLLSLSKPLSVPTWTTPQTYTTNSSALTISGTATESSGTVNGASWICDRCGSGNANFAAPSWDFGVTLKSGINTISVTATDALGGKTTEVLAVTYAPSFPGNTLAGAWALDEASGANVVDSSGNGGVGTLINSTARTPAKFQNGVALNGTTQYINVADSNALHWTQGFTISLWLNLRASYTNFRAAVVKNATVGDGIGDYVIALYASNDGTYCNPGSPVIYIQTNGSLNSATACAPPIKNINSPVHLAATYDGVNGGGLKIYVDGVLAQSVPVSGYMQPTTGALTIGASVNYGEFLDANWVDEVRVYNFALPLAGTLNTTPNAGCTSAQRTEANGTTPANWSIIGSMNCSIISPAPPLSNKWPAAASGLKVGAGATWKWAVQ